MDDAFLVSMLNGVTDVSKELDPLLGGKFVLITIFGDLDTADQFHDEEGAAGFGSTRVEDLGDVGMIHEGQGLALGFKAGDDLSRVHAQLDDLQRYPPFDRFFLFRHVDNSAAAFANLL